MQTIKQSLFTIIVCLILLAGINYVMAWTAPSASPPGSNVSTPLNTGSTNQTKSAGLSLDGSTYGLWADGTSYGVFGQESDSGAYGYLGVSNGYGGYFVGKYGAFVHDSDHGTSAYLAHQGYGIHSNGIIRGSYFMDHNNTGYYVDPASVSYLNDVRANIIYDRQNTGYYVDPASTSKFNTINLGGVSRSSWPSGGGNLSIVRHSGHGCASCPCGYQAGRRGASSNCYLGCAGRICTQLSYRGSTYTAGPVCDHWGPVSWVMDCIE